MTGTRATIAAGPNTASDVEDEQLVEWWGLVVEAFAAVTRAAATDLARRDLSLPCFEVLLRLRRTPGHKLKATELANDVSFSSGGLSKLVDRMAAAGQVRRVPCRVDRRVTWVILTQAGRRLADAATADHAGVLRDHVLAPLGTRELARFAAAARAVRDASAPATAPVG